MLGLEYGAIALDSKESVVFISHQIKDARAYTYIFHLQKTYIHQKGSDIQFNHQ